MRWRDWLRWLAAAACAGGVMRAKPSKSVCAWRRAGVPLNGQLYGLLAGILLVLWSAFFWASQVFEQKALARADEHGAMLALALAEGAGAKLHGIDNDLLMLREGWRSDAGRFAAVAAQHQAHLASARLGIAVTDGAGQVKFAQSTGPRVLAYLADYQRLGAPAAAPSDHMTFSQPIFDSTRKQWLLVLSRSILPTERTAGFVHAVVDAGELLGFASQLGRSEPTLLALVNAQGQMLASSLQANQRGDNSLFKTVPFVTGAPARQGRFVLASALDQVERSYAYQQLPNYAVTAVAGADLTQQLAPLYAGKRLVLWLFGAISLVLLGIVALMRRTLSNRDALAASLRESESLHQRLFDASSVGIYRIETDGQIVQANQRLAELFGCTVADLLSRSYLSLVDASERAAAQRNVAAFMRGELNSVDLERRYQRVDGRYFIGHLTCRRFFDASGNFRGLLGDISDITERKKADQQVQLAASVFTAAREGIVITDVAANILEVNNSFCQITGYSRAEVIGQNPRILKSTRQSAAFYQALWQQLSQTGYWSGEIWNRHKEGALYAEMLTITAVRNAAGEAQNYVGIFSDITEHLAHQSQLEHLAYYDVLTGLPNRLLKADRLRQAMAQCLRRGLSLAVAYLDLDDFKSINECWGNPVGDALLLELARRMSATLREGDTLARMGGDEFVVILVDLEQPQDCYPMLERLLRVGAAPVSLAGNADPASTADPLELQVSVSMGVTLYPQDRVDADQLVRHADQAMYLAKQDGKNRYHLFDVAQQDQLQSRQEELQGIRLALERDEFVLYYQPKVNLETGLVIGAEALIRWQHPQRGFLPPAAFLPLLENHPLSIELGEWVIATALEQMAQWRASGLDLAISVNVDAKQFQQGNFAERLGMLLQAQASVPAHSLQIEVLETSALGDLNQVRRIMHEVQAAGVSFALDDFGTGYSSLAYLRHLPAEMLKIDQSFVRDMLTDSDALAIVKGVVGLALAFRREVIAEGVETRRHADQLLALHCVLVQGYGVARPMPAAALAEWTAAWQRQPRWTA